MEGKPRLTRRVGKHKTRANAEPTRSEVPRGTDVVNSRSADGEEDVVGADQVSPRPAAAQAQEQRMKKYFSSAGSVPFSRARILAEDRNGVVATDRSSKRNTTGKGSQALTRRTCSQETHHHIRWNAGRPQGHGVMPEGWSGSWGARGWCQSKVYCTNRFSEFI